MSLEFYNVEVTFKDRGNGKDVVENYLFAFKQDADNVVDMYNRIKGLQNTLIHPWPDDLPRNLFRMKHIKHVTSYVVEVQRDTKSKIQMIILNDAFNELLTYVRGKH